MARELRTVSDSSGVPILEVVKDGDNLTIYEADYMDADSVSCHHDPYAYQVSCRIYRSLMTRALQGALYFCPTDL